MGDDVAPSGPGQPRGGLPIEQIGPDLHRYVARVLAECYDLPLDADLAHWCREVMAAPGRTTYAAFDGWTIVAVASLLVEGESARLSRVATLPSWRGRGIEADMVARRREDAEHLGVSRVHLEDAEAGPGEVGDPGIGPIQPQ